ncbi:unnamed protein product [Cuscuta epithymum]|uniref:Uncharacterized protein n=1 Tax=Cuscuta epithymum TaxID=186058 RepID=A0AAV0DZC4_9ASTE|nr:unnamed protein product [Cuscuta epithymum]
MGDLFKHNLPGIICWFIWKAYSAHTWGTVPIPTKKVLIYQIKHHTQPWSANFSKMKQRRIETYLIQEGMIAHNFTYGRPMFHRWKRPQGEYKLNVDASFSYDSSAGGAIFRDKLKGGDDLGDTISNQC